MPAASTQQLLVGLIGLWSQVGVTLLLSALFFVLRRSGWRRTYFTTWAEAWLALLVALAALLARYTLWAFPDLGQAVPAAQDAALTALLFVAHQFGKLLGCGLLMSGAAMYTRGFNFGMLRRFLLPAMALYAVVSVFVADGLEGAMVWQAPVAAVSFGICGWLLLSLAPSRAGIGSRVTGTVFAVMAAQWVLYGIAFAGRLRGAALPMPLDLLTRYNTFFDLPLEMLLAFGMVVIQMEDAKREADDARTELAVSNDRLRRMAMYDALTECLNRRAFAEGIGLEFAKSTFGTVVMLDMDNLKEINDGLGHAAGDELLAYLARTLRGGIRPLDRLYRWGGDEFLVVLPGAKAEGVAQRLQQLIAAAAPIPLGADRKLVRLEISIGAEGYAGGDELPGAIDAADATMYRAKRLRKATPARGSQAVPASRR